VKTSSSKLDATLSLADFWRLSSLIDAVGEDEAACRLGVTVRQVCEAMWPGTSADVLERVRAGLPVLGRRKVVKHRARRKRERKNSSESLKT
jgi:hypothetical protein